MKPFKENGLVPETTERTYGSRRFPKNKNLLILGILAKGGGGDNMKKIWKPEILEMAECDIFYVQSGADHDDAIENWLQHRFVEL